MQWVLIRKLIIFLIEMPCAMGLDKGIYHISHRNALRRGSDKEIDYISHRNALQWVLISELIIFLIIMPCDRI